MKKIILVLLLLLLSACGGNDSKLTKTSEPDFVVSTGILSFQIKRDSLNTFLMYDEKITKVAGLVYEVEIFDDYATIEFEENITCRFTNDYEDLDSIQQNDVIEVMGFVDKVEDYDVFMEECVFLGKLTEVEYSLTLEEFLEFDYEEVSYAVVEVTGEVLAVYSHDIAFKDESTDWGYVAVNFPSDYDLSNISESDIVTLEGFTYGIDGVGFINGYIVTDIQTPSE